MSKTRIFAILSVVLVLVGISIVYPSIFRRGQSNAVGCSMEGTVTNVIADGDRIHIQMNGKVTLKQYRGARRTRQSVIEVDCKSGLSATVKQGELFIAVSPDGRVAGVRKEGELLKILQVAAAGSRVVKFELFNPVVSFGDRGITNLESAVTRATDADLLDKLEGRIKQ